MDIPELYTEWAGAHIAGKRPLTEDEVEVLRQARIDHPHFSKWFKEVCECTIPMLGRAYTDGLPGARVRFAKRVKKSELVGDASMTLTFSFVVPAVMGVFARLDDGEIYQT